MDTRNVIVREFETVAAEQKCRLAPLSDDMVLLDSGLDSLCFAILVARLEDTLGFDPFGSSDAFEFPVTLSDFVRLYERVPA